MISCSPAGAGSPAENNRQTRYHPQLIAHHSPRARRAG